MHKCEILAPNLHTNHPKARIYYHKSIIIGVGSLCLCLYIYNIELWDILEKGGNLSHRHNPTKHDTFLLNHTFPDRFRCTQSKAPPPVLTPHPPRIKIFIALCPQCVHSSYRQLWCGLVGFILFFSSYKFNCGRPHTNRTHIALTIGGLHKFNDAIRRFGAEILACKLGLIATDRERLGNNMNICVCVFGLHRVYLFVFLSDEDARNLCENCFVELATSCAGEVCIVCLAIDIQCRFGLVIVCQKDNVKWVLYCI